MSDAIDLNVSKGTLTWADVLREEYHEVMAEEDKPEGFDYSVGLSRPLASGALQEMFSGRDARMKPRLLDLFCGAGGAAVGYARAGFDVVGVDMRPIKDYPFTFVQGDALNPPFGLGNFDVIHASPPCQPHSSMTNMANASTELDLLPQTRSLLQASGKPYVIENVQGAPMIKWMTLCGSMFGLNVRRHRVFETNVFMWGPPPCNHASQEEIRCYVGRSSSPTGPMHSKAKLAKGMKQLYRGSVKAGVADMGIDWMTQWYDLCEAIPPAYTEFIGQQLLQHLNLGSPANE